MHLCQALNGPPGFGVSLPAILPNITGLGDRFFLFRATAPAKKSRRIQVAVSMLSQRIIFRAFAHYERVAWWNVAIQVSEGGLDFL